MANLGDGAFGQRQYLGALNQLFVIPETSGAIHKRSIGRCQSQDVDLEVTHGPGIATETSDRVVAGANANQKPVRSPCLCRSGCQQWILPVAI